MEPGPTHIYTRYRMPSSSTTTTMTSASIISEEETPLPTDYKRSYTIDNFSSLDYFNSADTIHPELTPSAAIRDRYYQSTRYLQKHSNVDEEDIVYEEGLISGDILDYRPDDSKICTKPEDAPSLYSLGDSVISLRTEYNDDTKSVTSIRTMDDRLQGRSMTLGGNLNSFAVKTAKKVSRSGSLFRTKNSGKLELPEKKRLEPFMPVRDSYSRTDNSSAKTTGGMSLLSKLSKSTAPMRAKLSSLSAFSSKNSSLSSRKRVAESVYNMPVSVPSSFTLSRPLYATRMNSDRSSVHHLPRSLSASSSTSSNSTANIIISSTLVEEPGSLPVVKEYLPSVYPALLSKVSEAFKDSIELNIRTKDSIKYKDAFDGKEAVDKLSGLIKSNDRNLALLLGRALDAQKFFHDVNYEHRLINSSQELYQFKEHVRPVLPGQLNRSDSVSELNVENSEEDVLPTGVFTLLTDCYSPTCTGEKLCYSSRCPRRQEQTKNAKRGHNREGSFSLITQQEERLWIKTVPPSLLSTLSNDEKKRQENIFELVYTEKDFVDDVNYMIEYWKKPLLAKDSEVTGDREALVENVFGNIEEIYNVNRQLSEALDDRQSASKIVDKVGDIMLANVKNFEPFVRYGAHQIIGKYAFETEKSTNPSFAEFVSKTERLSISRKLELNGYLTKPTTRLGRYNLLLREILKHTPKDHPDQKDIPEAMAKIAKLLSDVNRETGITENRFELERLDERLVNKHISHLDLDLLSDSRQIIMKGTWKKSSGSESSDLLVYLLDHCLLILKPKQNEEKYKLYRKPIPLPVLSISFPDHAKRGSAIITLGRPSNASSTGSVESGHSGVVSTAASVIHQNKTGYPVSFVHLGKQSSGPMTLYASTSTVRKQWSDKIEGQRKMLAEKHRVFNVKPINQSFFSSFNKVNCISVFDKGKSFVLGGDQGVYLKKEGDRGDGLTRILAMDKVSQIDILEPSNLILVLADKILYTYSLDTLLTTETGMKRGRKLSSHVSFFKVGRIWDKSSAAITAACATAASEEEKSNLANGIERTLVCFVRYSAMTSTIRALEPYDSTESRKKIKHKNFNRLIRGNNEALKVYKDLYIPGEASSIQFFKNIICVGSARGFQMVNLSSAEVQSVLDPNDDNNNMLLAQHESVKPISMFRHKNGNILLCYNELAFYIDKKGKRVRKEWCITWESNPTAFSFKFPYVVAFNPNFIEVRHMDSGDLLQVIPGNNIRCLCPDSTEGIYGVMDDRIAGNEVIFELNLYEGSRRKPSMFKNVKKDI